MGNLKYANLPADTSGHDTLAQLALDLSRPWRHAPGSIWRQLNPELWDLTHNPWFVLQTVSGEKLESITADPEFQKTLEDRVGAQRADNEASRWFENAHPNPALKRVAYFSMEFMLNEGLPIYSGGLGNVAGDQLKAANDLGVPVTGVGLFYDQGYFRQEIDRDGAQRALYPFNDPGQLPIRPLRDKNGDWLRLSIPFPGCQLWIRTWEVQVGRAKLYLLDTNDPANVPEYRGITSELYGGGPDQRLRQEHVLGVGGWRLLRALGIEPEVCHLNEGHAAFAVLDRAASYMDDTGHPFEVALAVTRAGNLFTTHTPVEAGFDRFPPDLMRSHFGQYCVDRLRISFEQLMALGRRDGSDMQEPLNMAYLALRGSGAANGVSRLHGEVSRALLQPLFPRWPAAEVPIGHVTNGVHAPTWDSWEAHRLWIEACGDRCWRGDLAHMEEQVRAVADAPLWQMRTEARKALVEYIRTRYSRQVAIEGGDAREIAAAGQIFNPSSLMVGFARRFATYKRPNLLLHDPDRLMRILRNPRFPVQLVIAGKAHPKDGAGQQMIRQWIEFIRQAGEIPPVIFLSDYDMRLTERLVAGIDLWLNTPRRPWEASGTSGMKVVINGGLNLSELDGWWAEAYTPDVGWALGDGHEHGDDPAWDAIEAEALYDLLEHQVVPAFYERNAEGIPTKWVSRMRESMARLAPRYSANRAVREYTECYYLPAASGYLARADQNGKLGAEVSAWRQELEKQWNAVAFGSTRIENVDGKRRFEVTVYLGALDPGTVRVELFAEAGNGHELFRQPMERWDRMVDDGYVYFLNIEDRRDSNDFTARVIPFHPHVSVPFEGSWIRWQK